MQIEVLHFVIQTEQWVFDLTFLKYKIKNLSFNKKGISLLSMLP